MVIVGTVLLLFTGCIQSPEQVAMKLENKASNAIDIQSGDEQMAGDVIFALNAKSKEEAQAIFNSIKSELANRSFKGKQISYKNIENRTICTDWWEAAFDKLRDGK